MVMQQFTLLAENVQKAFPNSENEGVQAITQQVDNIKTSRERWPSKILKVFKERVIPVFGTEDITKLNQSHMSRVEDVNDARKRHKESLRGDIQRKKKQLDDVQSKRDKVLDTYESIATSARNEQSIYQPQSIEYRRLATQIAAATDSFNNSMQRLLQTEIALQQELTAIERNYLPIRLLSTQSNQKNLICPKQNAYLGWLPHLDSYQMIINTKVPPADEIFRNISYEPETKLSNLPLSIFNLIFYADSIGADDKNLLTMIVIFLKKYKSDIWKN